VARAAQVRPDQHLARASAYRTLGNVLKYEGRYDDGLQLIEKARTLLEEQLGPDHPDVGSCLRDEVDIYAMRHDGAGALAMGKRALAVLSRALPPTHLQIAQAHTNLAEAYGLLGRYEDALAEERRALPTYRRIFGDESEDVGVSYVNSGWALMQLGRDDEARADLTHALAIYDKTPRAGTPDVAEPLLRLGQLELKHKRYGEAQKLLERALQLRQRDRDPTEMLADIEQALGQALMATGSRARAVALFERARDQLHDAGKEQEAALVTQRLEKARR
jgi:tetratricopeptide (TPR) repeat protein